MLGSWRLRFFSRWRLRCRGCCLPLKRLWLKLGNVLHLVVSPIILGILYVFSIVTVGLITRLFGKDLLSLKRDAAATSYWIRREPPGPSPHSLKNQF